MRELVEAAESPRGAPLWLEGRCVSYGESLPYWPYRDVLREWLGVSLQEPELRLRISLRREVERLFGERVLEIYPYLGAMLGLTLEAEAASRLDELSPEAVQYRTFEVVGELVARLADERPSCSPSTTCTGPMRPRSSSPSSCSGSATPPPS